MTTEYTPAQRVGHQVRVALVEHHVSQVDIARLLGLTHVSIGRRVSGAVPFRVDELIQIAEYLGVEPERFFRPVPQPRGGDADDPPVTVPGSAERTAA